MKNKELWQATLAQIQLTISPANFATWFRETEIVHRKDGEIIISVSNSFAKEWLENKYGKTILKILHSLDEKIRAVLYKVGKVEIRISRDSKISLPKVGQLGLQEFIVQSPGWNHCSLRQKGAQSCRPYLCRRVFSYQIH